MGSPIDDTATLSTIADAMIRDPLETPTAVMKRLGMEKSSRTRVLRKWARHATKLKREAKRRAEAENVYRAALEGPNVGWQQSLGIPSFVISRTKARVKELNLKLDVPAFLHEPAPEPRPPTAIGRWMQRHPTIARIFWFSP